MIAGLINDDVDGRLADLHAALSDGREIAVKFESAYEHSNTSQPDRLIVDILGTPRRLVFAPEMAKAVAAQLLENGMPEASAQIKDAIPMGPKYGGPDWGPGEATA